MMSLWFPHGGVSDSPLGSTIGHLATVPGAYPVGRRSFARGDQLNVIYVIDIM